MKYTVLSTSGWQGTGWHVAGFCESLKEAKELQAKIQTTDARSGGYLTRIVRGWGKGCAHHSDLCAVFDLRHVRRGEKHLRGIVHANYNEIGMEHN